MNYDDSLLQLLSRVDAYKQSLRGKPPLFVSLQTLQDLTTLMSTSIADFRSHFSCIHTFPLCCIVKIYSFLEISAWKSGRCTSKLWLRALNSTLAGATLKGPLFNRLIRVESFTVSKSYGYAVSVMGKDQMLIYDPNHPISVDALWISKTQTSFTKRELPYWRIYTSERILAINHTHMLVETRGKIFLWAGEFSRKIIVSRIVHDTPLAMNETSLFVITDALPTLEIVNLSTLTSQRVH